MTEREQQQKQDATTDEPSEGRKLSTADMAAAAQRSSSQSAVRTTLDEDAVPIAEPQEVPKMGDVEQQSAARPTSLLGADETPAFRSRWDAIQTGFVDEPRGAVEQADSLVAEVMKRLAETFANERAKLEEQWSRGDDVSTEDLRIALQRYRSFFDRLLSL
jgi:hypothetical protein